MARWRTRRPALAALLIASAWLTGAPAFADLRFAWEGEPRGEKKLAALRQELVVHSVRVREPYEDRDLRFLAFSLDALLDTVYGPRWRAAGDRLLLFTCRDGYQPTLPVARVLNHKAWLAFAREESEAFVINKLESGEQRRIDLGPFYLIWENLEDAQVRAEGDYGWPYQLVGIDLVRAEDRFPKMIPPADASEDARAGFAAFQIHCSRCHTMNGEGGAIGPELNAPHSAVEIRDRAWLARWIDDPSQLVPAARMPRLAPGTPDRRETIERLIAYLETMAATRRDAARGR